MALKPAIRRAVFALHMTVALAWLGAVAAYLAPAIAGMTSSEPEVIRSAQLALWWILRFVIVPLALAALITGLFQSLGTEWGLFKHYWIVAKLVLSVGAVLVLLGHLRTVRAAAGGATLQEQPVAEPDLRVRFVVHAAGGLAVLVVLTLISVYKPWGRTPSGARLRDVRRTTSSGVASPPAASTVQGSALWRRLIVVVLAALVLLALAHHLSGGGIRRH